MDHGRLVPLVLMNLSLGGVVLVLLLGRTRTWTWVAVPAAIITTLGTGLFMYVLVALRWVVNAPNEPKGKDCSWRSCIRWIGGGDAPPAEGTPAGAHVSTGGAAPRP